ncbi:MULTISPECIES: hypothetical protein [Eikenella]|uniref:Lipoprotein n=1 Tax=Eikenella longinqua TaxID=1795827 RepID=A0A1A9RWN0_9NEIS|nr:MULTISPECIES: hypothetical protein [Eikenella]OAM29067.1 hypothetical protein A7P95_04860 [Eikenella longinqua]
MPKLRILLAALALSACTALGSQNYSGESATFGGDHILRNDVTRTVLTAERAAHNCSQIQSIRSKVLQARKVRGRWQVREEWAVQACGKTHRYHIGLFEDARGETDYTVRRISR